MRVTETYVTGSSESLLNPKRVPLAGLVEIPGCSGCPRLEGSFLLEKQVGELLPRFEMAVAFSFLNIDVTGIATFNSDATVSSPRLSRASSCGILLFSTSYIELCKILMSDCVLVGSLSICVSADLDGDAAVASSRCFQDSLLGCSIE